MNKLMDGTEYIVFPNGHLQEVTFSRQPTKGETDYDVCRLDEGDQCRHCDYLSLAPE